MTETELIGNIYKQLESNVNLSRGVIYLEGEIETYSAAYFIDRVYAIQDYRPTAQKNDPINLYITSPGGDVNGLTAITDIIGSLSCKVNTYGFGNVESAAVWILASGTGTRYIAPNAEIMIHEMSAWMKGTTSSVENEAKQIKIMQKNLYALLEKFTKHDVSFWTKKIKGTDVYLTPEVCINYGIADKIITNNSL